MAEVKNSYKTSFGKCEVNEPLEGPIHIAGKLM
jgi:hypothetical protein